MPRLLVTICGNTDPDAGPEDIPREYLGDDEVQDAVLWVASEIPARHALYDRYPAVGGKLDNLFRVGALREEGGKVLLGFTLFTGDDHRVLYAAAAKHAETLAEGILARRSDIADSLARLRYNRAGARKTATIVVGCLCLDGGGLQTLEKAGYIVGEKRQAGGTFTVAAEERVDLDLTGIYWGCHSDAGAGLSFVSFGDHASPGGRNALPDLLWRRLFTARDEADRVYVRLAQGYQGVLRRDLVRVVRHMARFPKEPVEGTECSPDVLEDWLRSLGYIDGDGGLAVPYLADEDAGVVAGVKDVVVEQVLRWAGSGYDGLRADMRATTPVRHGVDFREVFVHVWHWVFGLVNKRLAEKGMLFDAYEAGHRSPGCVPAVVEDGVWQALRG